MSLMSSYFYINVFQKYYFIDLYLHLNRNQQNLLVCRVINL